MWGGVTAGASWDEGFGEWTEVAVGWGCVDTADLTTGGGEASLVGTHAAVGSVAADLDGVLIRFLRRRPFISCLRLAV